MNFDSIETKIDLLVDFTVLVESLDILILNLQKTTLPMNIFNYAVCLAGCDSIPFQIPAEHRLLHKCKSNVNQQPIKINICKCLFRFMQ